VDDPARGRTLTTPDPPLAPEGLDATLVLVRHGESTFIAEGRFQGRADAPLSAFGRRQAALTAARLARPHATPALPIPSGELFELVNSPLARASQTADAIETALASAGVAPRRSRPDPGFAEIGQGAWEGLHRDEVQARYGAELSAWRRTPLTDWAPGGESLPDVSARVRPALQAVLGPLAEGRTPGTLDRSQVAGYHEPVPPHPWSIVVGHDGVFKVVLLTLFDLPLDRFWMWSMDPCGITVIEFRAGRPVMRAHDLTAHLGGAQEDQAMTEPPDDRGASGAL
jgi:probable phosphoglycerate mutase